MPNVQLVGMIQIVDQRLMPMGNQWSVINESYFATHFCTELSFYNLSVVMTPEIFWNVITETWPLVYNPLCGIGFKKEDISKMEISLIMTNP